MRKRHRILLVDDEPIARRHLRVYIEREEDLEIVGEAGSGEEAILAIREGRPDLVFLDVQMPGLDGFGVLERLLPGKLPAIVFVTAYDQYAVRAFRVQALDYLLKPFDDLRFAETLERARRHLERPALEALSERLEGLVRQTSGRLRPLERLAVKRRGESIVVKTDTIDWIEAQANYARLHCGGESHLVRRSLSSLEEVLDPFQFARIHRAAIVNADRIRRLVPWSHGDIAHSPGGWNRAEPESSLSGSSRAHRGWSGVARRRSAQPVGFSFRRAQP